MAIFKRNKLSHAVVIVSYGMLSSAVWAQTNPVGQQDADSPKVLQTVQVLGAEEEGFNVAINADMIEKRQASDLEDLLRHEPSITVGGGLPVAQKIYVRGLEDTLLNVTIDGAPQAGYLYHHQGRISVEPELIKEVVVKAGAGNATDGAGALGGAIHFKLKDAADLLEEGKDSGAMLKTSFFSNNNAIKNHGSAYSRLNGDFGLLASFTNVKARDNYEDGRGDEVENSEVEQRSIRIRLSGQLNDDHYLAMSLEDYQDQAIRFARPNMGALFHPVYPSTPVPQTAEREAAQISYGYNPDSDNVDLSVTAGVTDSYFTKTGDLFANWPPGNGFRDYHNGEAHGGGVLTRHFDLRNTFRTDSIKLTAGAEYREDEGYLINPAISRFNNEELSVMALYAQADIDLGEQFTISTGVRYDDYDYTDNGGNEFNDEGFSPNLTATVDVTEAFSIHAGYAQAFKGVSIPEVWFLEFPPLDRALTNYQGDDFEDDGFILGKVQAEESDNIEIGFKYEGETFAASGEYYKQTIENALTTGPTTRYSYVADVKVKGYALRTALYLGDLSVNMGVSESKPELDGKPLSSADMGLGSAYGRTWTTGVEYDGLQNWSFGWNARFVERLDDVREGQAEQPGYGVNDLYAQWLPTDALTVGLAINNVFDQYFFDQGSFYSRDENSDPIGLPEPGRDIRLSMAYRF